MTSDEPWRTSSRSCGNGECVEVSLPQWRTSSRSASNGACVEVSLPRWHKATRSMDNGNCVEVADLDGAVGVRDSKDPDGGRLTFAIDYWSRFVAAVKAGDFG